MLFSLGEAVKRCVSAWNLTNPVGEKTNIWKNLRT